MPARNVIRAGQTKWAYPIVFLSKKNRSLFIAVNCHNLNRETSQDSYSIPRTKHCIYSGSATVTQKMDENDGYCPLFTSTVDLYLLVVLANRDRQRKSRQNHVHTSSCPRPFYSDAVQMEDCLCNISTSQDHPIDRSQTAVCFCQLRGHHHIFTQSGEHIDHLLRSNEGIIGPQVDI